MAGRKILTQDALITLGPEKLAALVLGECDRNPAFKKLATAAIAGGKGPGAVAAIVDRRLASLERARGFIDWQKRRAFAADLKATSVTIADELGPVDPGAAVARLVRFLVTSERVFERVDDSTGTVQEVYRQAAVAILDLVERLDGEERGRLAAELLPRALAAGYGLIEGVFTGLIPLLSPPFLTSLEADLAKAAAADGPQRDDDHDWQRRARQDRIIRARQAIAEQRGDLDTFIALELRRPQHVQDTLRVAERLLSAGRHDEALDWVRRRRRAGIKRLSWEDIGDGAPPSDLAERGRAMLEARILHSMGAVAAAQAVRWQAFEASLDAAFLRDYLGNLPDFGEFDALDRAFAHALDHPQQYRALSFLLAWPRLDLASKLVLEPRVRWDGRNYGVLVPAAESLEAEHPAAATALYRALIDDILGPARSPAYGHAARYLARIDALAENFSIVPGMIDHEDYRAGLKQAHGRKSGFWSIVTET